MPFLPQVHASDPDSGDFGTVRYAELRGDDVTRGLRLDAVSGEISVVDNQFLDREYAQSK